MNSKFTIKVTLTDRMVRVKGYPYRVIEIAGNKSLNDLAYMILYSFDFDIDHSYGFYNNLKNIYKSDERYELFSDIEGGGDCPGVKKTKLKDVYCLKKKMLFLFDYGDEWLFLTQCMKIEEIDRSINSKVIKYSGNSPEQYPDWDDEEEYDEN